MQLEVGTVLTGKVTGITKFGVFVDLGSGKSGMVHISEVASTYVKEIRDYVTDGQEIKVKILSIAEDGKISLSRKQAEPAKAAPANTQRPRQNSNHSGGYSNRYQDDRTSTPPAPQSFDDMLSKFMQTSDEKIGSLRKNNGDRRSSRRGTGSK